MKYITSALVILALMGEQSQAVTLQSKFTDDLAKSLGEDLAKQDEKEEAAKPAAPAKKEDKSAKKETKSAPKDAKKDSKKAPAKEKETQEKDEIPMDAAAIKAYSSVIADAAEDSEPSTPVEYHAMPVEKQEADTHVNSADLLSSDPIGSMVQNEISEIKDASIKAAKEKDE